MVYNDLYQQIKWVEEPQLMVIFDGNIEWNGVHIIFRQHHLCITSSMYYNYKLHAS